MPTELGEMKYLALAQEGLTHQVEGQTLRRKATSTVSCFLYEDVICRYGCIVQIVMDRGDLDSNEAHLFFSKLFPVKDEIYNTCL